MHWVAVLVVLLVLCAASAVAEFKPKFVYPYHYRGRDGGTQDPKKFAELVGDAAEVKLVDWYPGNDAI